MTRRGIVASLMTAVMLPVLIGLGIWQWQRLHWKEALVEEIRLAGEAPPAIMDESLPTKSWKLYQRVLAKGAFDHLQEQRVWTSGTGTNGESKSGWRVLTPMFFDRPGPPDHICEFPPVIMVDRGAIFGPLPSLGNKPLGPVLVEGRLFAGESSPFVGSKGGKAGEWTLADLDAMLKALRPPGEQCIGTAPTPEALRTNALPLLLVAETATGTDLPPPQPRKIELANRHLEYALTWWSFAGILLVVYGLFIWGERRKPHLRDPAQGRGAS
jgi:surfeit locus 1 family protein